MDLVVNKVLKNVALQYSTLSSYQDIAVVETTFARASTSPWITRKLCRTIYKAPNLFRFERRFSVSQSPDSKDQVLVVLFDGKNGYRTDANGKTGNIMGLLSIFHTPEKIINQCLADCFVFSGGSLQYIHPLFFQHIQGQNRLERKSWISDLRDENNYILQDGNLRIAVSRDRYLLNEFIHDDLKDDCLTRTRISPITLNAEINDRLFDKNLLEQDTKSGLILAEAKQSVGPFFEKKEVAT